MTLESTADTRTEADYGARSDEVVDHLAEALRATDDVNVRYHVRQALQLLDARDYR